MNITLEVEKTKEEIDSLKKLDIILKDKKADFIKNIFFNYSHTEKSTYIEKNNLKVYDLNIYDVTVFALAFWSIIACLILQFSDLWMNSLLCFMAGIFLALLHKLTFFQKFTAKKWLKKKENRIKLECEMFLDYVIDKEVMKTFAECYGEEALVELMFKKQNLKYRDILVYMNKERKISDDNNEKIRLRNAVKCLAKQE